MAVATPKKLKIHEPQLTLPDSIPANHRLAICAPSQGDLSDLNRETLEGYWAEVEQYLVDECELHQDRESLLATGFDLSIREVVNRAEEIKARKAALESRQREIHLCKFPLAASMLRDFRRIVEETKQAHERTIDQVVETFAAQGVTPATYGVTQSKARDELFRRRAAEEIPCMASREKMKIAAMEFTICEEWAAIANRASGQHSPTQIKFAPVTDPEQQIVAKLAGLE